ncbi:MAG TPA: hypothetical protein ENJ51_11590, partial [Leucothrix mucor]|nr:hypothetical protein [Leucothrix mucor]
MRIFSLILLSLTLLFTQLSVNSVYAADVSVADFFDIDNDGKKEALSDGLLISRYLFGFRGSALIDQAIANGATRTTATAIETYLTDNLAKFDVDGDGETKALSDGLLILRYLFGFRGNALINNAIAGGATRTTAIQVATYITEGGESDPEFIKKAEAIAFSQINLYQGHVKEGDVDPVDLNVANLNSGDLFTVDVEFEISEDLDDYALTAQLIPMDIFNKLNTGNTLGVVSSENVTAEESKRIIDLGGAYIDEIKSGILHGVIHTKLPTLENDTTYKVVVTPTLDFLATHKNVIKADYKKVPLLIDPRELVVHKLDKVRVKIVNLPDITEKNDFTQLEKYGRYDANGYSLEPLFQTSLEVDVSSFNQSEEVVISLSWECKEQSCYDKGVAGKYELGLWDPKSGGDLSHDQKISSDVIIGHTYTTNGAHHNVKSSGRSYSNYSYGRIRTVIIPLAPYVNQSTHDALVTQCLSFSEIASTTPKMGNFILDVKHAIEGKLIDTGINYTLSIPLVCQDNRAKELSNEQASGFSVLRAGNTNQACLDIPRSAYEGDPLEGTETGFLKIDANEEIIASTCPENSPNTSLLWRYSKHTKQFISKDVDSNGDHYCLTSRSTGLVYADMPLGGADILGGFPGGFPGGSGGGEFTEVDIKKCEFQQVGIAPPEQRFELLGDKIKAVDNRYLTVSNIGSSSAFALEDVELVSLNHTPAPVD